uniref:Ras-GAP domain-containing protein n=1 Tax=Heterorhabditis bacteriophora TaxID=37862 RepID=A0A1I7WSF0_HETBA
MDALTGSSSVEPFSASLVSLLENMPQVGYAGYGVDGSLASRLCGQLLLTYFLYIVYFFLSFLTYRFNFRDLNTLFRSHSLASKMLYELLKIYGHSYLLISLKPVIDKIYKERKCCEIDPSRLPQGESLEKNTANLLSYFSLLFSRVADSASRCPLPIKVVLADLRRVEPWLTTILSHVTDDAHLLAMSCFLDRISLEYSGPSLSTEHIAVLKDGVTKCNRICLLVMNLLITRHTLLQSIFSLENSGSSTFRSKPPHMGGAYAPGRLFGGQAVAQAYRAIQETRKQHTETYGAICTLHHKFTAPELKIMSELPLSAKISGNKRKTTQTLSGSRVVLPPKYHILSERSFWSLPATSTRWLSKRLSKLEEIGKFEHIDAYDFGTLRRNVQTYRTFHPNGGWEKSAEAIASTQEYPRNNCIKPTDGRVNCDSFDQ